MPSIRQRLADGEDADALTAERNALVEKWLALPGWVVKRMFRRRHPSVLALGREDAVQVGFLALIRAAERFDPGRGRKFSTFAAVVVRNEVAARGKEDGTIYVPATAFNKSHPKLNELAEKARRTVRLAHGESVRPLGNEGLAEAPGPLRIEQSESFGGDVPFRDLERREHLTVEEVWAAARAEARGLTEGERAAVLCLARGGTTTEAMKLAGVGFRGLQALYGRFLDRLRSALGVIKRRGCAGG